MGKVSVAPLNLSIFSSDSTIDGVVTLGVKRLSDKVYSRIEVAVVCEERATFATSHRGKRVEVTRKDILEAPQKFSSGNHRLEFEINLGDLSEYPSSMDLTEELGIFWWLEVYMNSSPRYSDQFPLGVFPSRSLDLDLLANSDRHDETNERLIMIASTKEDAKPGKPRSKMLTAIIGEKYRHPANQELRELFVDAKVKVPKSGVLQSPHKAHLGFYMRCVVNKRVVLESVSVKLISKVESLRGEKVQTSVPIFERDIDMELTTQWKDLSHKIASLEMPPISETTSTDSLDVTYDLQITLVLRALNLYNLSHWQNLMVPVKILPSVIEEFSPAVPPPLEEASPPPYAG